MNVQCEKCLPKEGIEIPDFSLYEKIKLSELITQSPLQATKHIIDSFNFSLRDAKYIVTHINSTYGQCNRCSFGKLDEEYVKCPKCGALNFNWKIDDLKSI